MLFKRYLQLFYNQNKLTTYCLFNYIINLQHIYRQTKKDLAELSKSPFFMVEQIGIEPTASSVRGMRSPN